MKIGRSGCHIPQAGDANQHRFWRAQRMENAVPLEKIAANIHPLVAGYAAQGFKELIAGQLLWRNRAGFACQPSIEGAARRNKRPLVCRDRIQDSGGPGIVPFELAGGTERATEILGEWGEAGRDAAKLSL